MSVLIIHIYLITSVFIDGQLDLSTLAAFKFHAALNVVPYICVCLIRFRSF